MMMEKSKPEAGTTDALDVAPTTVNDREADIERRLAALGVESSLDVGPESNGPDVDLSHEPQIESCPPLADVDEVVSQPDQTSLKVQQDDSAAEKTVEDQVVVQETFNAPNLAPIARAEEEAKKADATGSVKPNNNKSALLARIMAAQERARQAQMKQSASAAAAAAAPDLQQSPFVEHLQSKSVQEEADKMMQALSGWTEPRKESSFEKNPKNSAEEWSLPAPPPPSLDVFEEQMMHMKLNSSSPTLPFVSPTSTAESTTKLPPPPSFDTIAPQIFAQGATASLPSMAVMNSSDADLLGGDFGSIRPMAPPVSAPSFDQVMQQHLNDGADVATTHDEMYDFDLDENGMKLSSEEKRKLIEEQRAIMEHIEREARNNKASEAAIKADAFAARMAGNASSVVVPPPEICANVEGFTASEIEEQKRILEQIQREAKGAVNRAQTGDLGNGSASTSGSINIGGGHNVQLHGQEKTQEAIKKGTAQLVLCLNCNNWMQVVESATLMFCPICSVVSPVVQQDQVMSKAELMQMEQDRELAEALQAEERAAARVHGVSGSYPGDRRAATSRATASSGNTEKSWWDTISEALVGVGVSANPPDSEQSKRSSEYHPPGSMSGSSPRMLHSAITGEEGGEERLGLLSSEGGSDGRPTARVAKAQPLFSCVVDSISSTANAASHYIMGEDDDDEDDVHGVDATSFLAVPNAGRDKNEGGGNYFAIPPDE